MMLSSSPLSGNTSTGACWPPTNGGGPAGHPTSVALESNLNSNHSYMEWADQASEESTTLGPQTKETKEKEWLSSSTCT